MIKRIIEADNAAKELEEQNRRSAEEETRRIDEKAQEIYRRYMENADQEIARNEENAQKEYERKLSEITSRQESVLIKLRSDFDQSRGKWVDEIVSRVLS